MQIVESDPCKCCKESRNARERKEGLPYLGARESLKRKTVECMGSFLFSIHFPPLFLTKTYEVLIVSIEIFLAHYTVRHRSPSHSIIVSDSLPVLSR